MTSVILQIIKMKFYYSLCSNKYYPFDNMSFLENLPDDIIITILLNLDYKSIFLMCQLSCNLSNFCQRNLDNILRQSLSKIIDLKTNDYNRQQLLILYQSLCQHKNISAGNEHSLILSNISQIYAFGYNGHGQLGLGDYTDKNSPTLILNLNHIIQIASGFSHSLALSNAGQVYIFGYSGSEHLGLDRV